MKKNHLRARTALLGGAAALYLKFCFASKRITRAFHPASRALLLARSPAILAFWHCSDFAAAWFFRGGQVFPLASLSNDGALMCEILRHLGVGIELRGSGNRGALAGVRLSLKMLAEGKTIAYAVDGSRGPRLRAKEGAVRVAALSGCPILPLGLADSHFKILQKTWDQNRCPLPGGRALLVVGKPLFIHRSPRAGDLERVQRAIERADQVAHQLLGVDWPG